jgi:hypothetical protein
LIVNDNQQLYEAYVESCLLRAHPVAVILGPLRGRRRWGFEFKRTSAPALTRSMHVALQDLRLQRLDVVHGGPHSFTLAPRVRAVAFSRLLEDVSPHG